MKNLFLSFALVCVLVGCGKPQPAPGPVAPGGSKVTSSNKEDYESFILEWSEYTSWSIISVASDRGLINGEQGKVGPLEQKWGVDIVLKEADYDTCITAFGTGTAHAACLTNIDSLPPSIGREAVFILPTSTSDGADAVIVQNDITLDDLKTNPTFGLEKSVSQYVFERGLVAKGLNPKDFTFTSLDPGAAAQALQTKQKNVSSICVWHPFKLATLNTRKDVKVLFDSSLLKEEVIDGILVGKKVLETKNGQNFACALIDTYYEINKQLDNKNTHDEVVKAVGEKFFDLSPPDVEKVLLEVKFYKTPDAALTLLRSDKFRKETIPTIVDFCVQHELITAGNLPAGKKQVAFDDEDGLLTFTTKYIELVKANPGIKVQ